MCVVRVCACEMMMLAFISTKNTKHKLYDDNTTNNYNNHKSV